MSCNYQSTDDLKGFVLAFLIWTVVFNVSAQGVQR